MFLTFYYVLSGNHLVIYTNYFNYYIDYVLGLTNDRRKNNVIPVLDLKVLGNNIKNLRIKNELSQENLANILVVTQACKVR